MTAVSQQYIVFTIDRQRYGMPRTDVEWVMQPTRLKLLTGSPGGVMGLVSVQGWSIPVVSLRKLLGLAERHLSPGNRLVILRKHGRKVALLVDSVLDGVTCNESTIAPAHQGANYSASYETESQVVLYEATPLLYSKACYVEAAGPNRIGGVLI